MAEGELAVSKLLERVLPRYDTSPQQVFDDLQNDAHRLKVRLRDGGIQKEEI